MCQHFNVSFTGSWTGFPSIGQAFLPPKGKQFLGLSKHPELETVVTIRVLAWAEILKRCVKFSGRNISDLRQGHCSLLLGCREQVTVVTEQFSLYFLGCLSFWLCWCWNTWEKPLQFLLSASAESRFLPRKLGTWAGQHAGERVLPHLTAQLCWLCRWVCSLSLPHCKIAEVKLGFN